MASCLGIGGFLLRLFGLTQPSSAVLPPPLSLVIATPTILNALHIAKHVFLVSLYNFSFYSFCQNAFFDCEHLLSSPTAPTFSIDIALSKKFLTPSFTRRIYYPGMCSLAVLQCYFIYSTDNDNTFVLSPSRLYRLSDRNYVFTFVNFYLPIDQSVINRGKICNE